MMHTNLYYIRTVTTIVMVLGVTVSVHAGTTEQEGKAENQKAAVSLKNGDRMPMQSLQISQCLGLTMSNCYRMIEAIGRERSFMGIILFISDTTKDGLPESGNAMEGEFTPEMKSTFHLKGVFRQLKVIQGDMPPLGRIDYRTKEIYDDKMVSGSSWQREQIVNKPHYPLAKAMSPIATHTSDNTLVLHLNTESRFVVVSDKASPEKIMDCRFIGPFTEEEIEPLNEALRWAATDLATLGQEELRTVLKDENPAKAMLALEQLRIKKCLTPQDHMVLFLHVPSAYTEDVLKDMFKTNGWPREEEAKVFTAPLIEMFKNASPETRLRIVNTLSESHHLKQQRWPEGATLLQKMKELLSSTSPPSAEEGSSAEAVSH